jgi:hypothetical protein
MFFFVHIVLFIFIYVALFTVDYIRALYIVQAALIAALGIARTKVVAQVANDSNLEWPCSTTRY